MKKFCSLLLLIATSQPSLAADPFFVASSSSVEKLQGSLSQVRPPVRTPLGTEGLLGPTSCLSSLGPIGAYGPLGTLGPLGSDSWNTSTLFQWLGGWEKLANYYTLHGGPLSADGPLGAQGPLGPVPYGKTLPAINDFAKQLQAGGVFSILGPTGPLGPLGALGPLGPLGAHGFQRTEAGSYTSKGKPVRDVTIDYSPREKRTFELVELYNEATAKSMKDGDTSFVALGEIERQESDEYQFQSARKQFVSIVIVPEYALDSFAGKLNVRGKTYVANSLPYVNWFQFSAAAGEKIKITVELQASGHILSKKYRLYVVGSHSIDSTDITGPHQLN